jgi:ribosome-associated heat shock protein Hsp15
MNPRPEISGVRIDKWLWAVRLYRTRTLATEACRAGHVKIDGENVKPSRSVRLGEVITARTGELKRTVKVARLLEQRVGARLVSNYLEDQTPAAEYLRVLEQRTDVPHRPKGAGRPTKKQRRDLEKLT